ncbi:MAG: SIMPL domain-containing protein [Actinomycetales bacterium]|nr:SIMPL domain-containing protein [Actinomycetales bacterium]
MTDVVLTVAGSARLRRTAERAHLVAVAAVDGPERDEVVARATELSARLQEALRGVHDAEAGPVRSWSAQGMQVGSHRPWDQNGQQLPLVHTASLEVRAEFDDPEALARFADEFSAVDGVQIAGISWRLTEATERETLRAARGEAVRDALERAADFAAALGLGAPEPVSLADPGLLDAGRPDGGAPAPKMEMMAQRSASFDSGPGLQFTPGEIEVAAGVEARFSARGSSRPSR